MWNKERPGKRFAHIGQISISSAGGDYPDYDGPINELLYRLVGSGSTVESYV